MLIRSEQNAVEQMPAVMLNGSGNQVIINGFFTVLVVSMGLMAP